MVATVGHPKWSRSTIFWSLCHQCSLHFQITDTERKECSAASIRSAVACSAVTWRAVAFSAVACSAFACSAVECSAVACSAVARSTVACSAVACSAGCKTLEIVFPERWTCASVALDKQSNS
jgi:hypothetical protein